MSKCTNIHTVHKKYFYLLVSLLLIIISACQAATPTLPAQKDSATLTAQMKNEAQIKLSDNGRTFSYHLTDRFSVFLEDTKYPIKDLTCAPEGIIAYISNGSLRGPAYYPIMFEAVMEGKCQLKDYDFQVEIVVKP